MTTAFIVIRRIDPIDGLVYILAQLSGGVLGALLTKAFLLDEGRASDYGTPKVSALLGGAFQGALIEGIGTFVLVLVVLAVALNPEIRRWAALAIGGALGLGVMVFGPLTGGSFNPARWFGPALVGNHFTDAWVYILGPLVGGLLAAARLQVHHRADQRPGAGDGRHRRPTRPGPAGRRGAAAAAVERPGRPSALSPPGGIAGFARPGRPLLGPRPDAERDPFASVAGDAQGHLLAQLHALAVEDVSVLLQVLRLRDAPGAHPRAR